MFEPLAEDSKELVFIVCGCVAVVGLVVTLLFLKEPGKDLAAVDEKWSRFVEMKLGSIESPIVPTDALLGEDERELEYGEEEEERGRGGGDYSPLTKSLVAEQGAFGELTSVQT